MSIRGNLDISAYFVVGPENTNGRPVAQIVKAVVEAGFTCLQIRSKTASARELIEFTRQAADIIVDLIKFLFWLMTALTLCWRQGNRELK